MPVGSERNPYVVKRIEDCENTTAHVVNSPGHLSLSGFERTIAVETRELEDQFEKICS